MKFKKFLLWLCLSFVIIVPSQVSAENFNYKNTESVLMMNGKIIKFEETNNTTNNQKYTYNENDWNLCTGTSNTAKNARKVFKLIGRILQIAFIAIPIILIVIGSIDFMKAVVASKDDEMKKAQSTFIKRCLAAIIVFFVPIITSILINTILDRSDLKTNCLTCVLNPEECNID